MELAVYWTQIAEDKIRDIFHFYRVKASPKVAKKLVIGIIDAALDLSNNPEMGAQEIFLESRPEKFRFIIYKNYKIIYWINLQQNRIEIANVFDTRQNPEKLTRLL